MSIDWFRSWHGAPTDPKWLLVARNAMKRSETQITPGMVSAVVWALFDHASQAEQRGNVEAFDVETYAVFSGFSEHDITAIIDAMKEKSLIVSGTLSAWEKRQPKREDNSTERVREHRNAMKRNETQGNARVDKSREEKKEHCPVVKTTRTAVGYSEEFETNFWKPYPKTENMSKKEAWREWMKLAPDKRLAACQAIAGYEQHLKRNPTLQTVHACRFLSQERAETILEMAAERPKFDIRGSIV